MALLARNDRVFVFQFISGVPIVLEVENVPAIGEVAAAALLLCLPKFFELVSVWVVMTTAALLESRHLSDLGPMASKAGDLAVLPREFESRLVVVKCPLAGHSLRRRTLPGVGGMAFFADRSVLSFMRIRMAVGTLSEGQRRPGLLFMAAVTIDAGVLSGEGIATFSVVIEGQSPPEVLPLLDRMALVTLEELRFALVGIGVTGRTLGGCTDIGPSGGRTLGLDIRSNSLMTGFALDGGMTSVERPSGVPMVERKAS